MKARRRNRPSGSIGSGTLRSTPMNAARSAAAAPNSAMIWALPQPASLPRSNASTSRNRPPLSVPSPSQSIRPAFGLRDSRTFMYVVASAAIPTGTLTKNTQRQPRPSVMTPPTSGPTATDIPMVAPYIAIAVPRSLPAGNSCATSASETANIAAPPIPSTARETFRKVASGASPAANDATEKIVNPAANTARRPRRSASEPAVNTTAASASV